MNNIRKISVEDCKQVALWIYDHFPNRGMNHKEIEKILSSRVDSTDIPYTIVAENQGELVGTASLVSEEPDGKEGLGPWLNHVFVIPEFRKKGIGSRLCAEISKYARSIKKHRLYTSTTDMFSWFQKQGWTVVEERPHNIILNFNYKIFSELPDLTVQVDALGGIAQISLEKYLEMRADLDENCYIDLVQADYNLHCQKESLVKRKLCLWCKEKFFDFCQEPDASILKICERFGIEKSDFSRIMLGHYMEYDLKWYEDLTKKIDQIKSFDKT